MLTETHSKSRLLLWLYAMRPKTLTAALIPVLVGSSLSISIEWSLTFCALISALLIQIGTNLVNDASDFKRGADTKERLGPPRATQMGWFSPHQVLAVGAACFFLAILSAIPLLEQGGWPIAVLIFFSVLSGVLYTAGQKPLAYIGLGDLFVLIFFGWMGTMTMYYLQSGTVTVESFIAGTQVGLLCTGIIAMNNLRDVNQDRQCGKRTLAVMFGVGFAKMEIIFLTLAPFVLNLFWLFSGRFLVASLTMIPLPIAWNLLSNIWKLEPGPSYNLYFYRSAMLHFAFGLLMTIAFLIS